ncbi:efflux RND transporter periplasmic adaptor subunit [Acetobacteraceae bacterium KSS12]|uniref:Efflux RND transporter periplasmic adaptor subunit n=2 Tax=Rhizosaccharibacter radicis TaxID=2782605 RepID=A0ABT1VXL5_9PROT|nr:efflux RND transporter periplasmic adaptor subunit [Acetobacteraceae bacterium KSS12]
MVSLLAIAAVLAAAEGILSRRNTLHALERRADDASIPRVQVITPTPGPDRRSLTLPGELNAWFEAPIYAQVSGYVKNWYKDYGATVKQGELLATIDAPTVDAQYATAKANLSVAQARSKLADVTSKRWSALQGTQAVSQQEVDVQVANAEAQKAQVEAAGHEVTRYAALESFKNVVAPFDGVVTSRLTDIGDYVNAAGGDVGSRGTASELFAVSDIHKMRVFVSVPQDYAGILRPGLTAMLSLPQDPEHAFNAAFLTTANAVNPQTRTVVTELTVDNPNRELWPGSYVTVKFSVPGDPNILVLPEQALLFRAQGMQVALLDDQNRVHMKNVTLGLNLGTTVQVLGGVTKTDRVINNPSLGLLEGERVKVVTPVHGYAPAPEKSQPARSAAGIVEPSASGTAPEDDVRK